MTVDQFLLTVVAVPHGGAITGSVRREQYGPPLNVPPFFKEFIDGHTELFLPCATAYHFACPRDESPPIE
jgi:hypothetical protein